MNRLRLLNDLCIEYPNAYVMVGETYIPTRSELYPFEIFNIAKQRNMFKYYKNLPIILTMDEDQKIIYEKFSAYLIFGNQIIFKSLPIDVQIDFIIFLKRICNDKEIANILTEITGHFDPSIELFSLPTWIKLMEYGMEPLFMAERRRIDICVAIYRGKYEFEKGDYNSIGYEFSKMTESTPQATTKGLLLSEALSFYKVTFKQLQLTHPYIKYSGSGYSN